MLRSTLVAVVIGSLSASACSHDAGPPPVAAPGPAPIAAPSPAPAPPTPPPAEGSAATPTPEATPTADASPHHPAPGEAAPPMQKTEPRTAEKLANGRTVLGAFTANVPAAWTVKPVTSAMRVASYQIGADTELVIYYFGEQGAGSVDDNLDRWFGQLAQSDGKDTRSRAKIEKIKLAGQDATVVSATGHYHAESMSGGPATDIADAAMLGAIVASPKGPYYMKLVGAKKLVDANASKFRAMLTSFELH